MPNIYTEESDLEKLLEEFGTPPPAERGLLDLAKQKNLLPNQTLFFTSEEARSVGMDVRENWMVKLTPSGGGYTTSWITPEKWEITADEMYISPTGEKYSKADLMALMATPKGDLVPESIVSRPRMTYENLTEEGRALYWEYQRTGGTADIPQWMELREEQQLQTEEIFGKVFADQDIQEVLAYAESNAKAFEQDIREIGRTPETEALLREMYEDASEEQLASFFEAPQLAEDFKQAFVEALKPVTATNVETMLDYFTSHPDALRASFLGEGRNEATEKLARMIFPEATEQQITDYFDPSSLVVESMAAEGGKGVWGTFTAGVGDLVANVGGVFRWAGKEGIGNKITKIGQYMQVQAAPIPFEAEFFTWKQLFNPQFYATYGVRMLPTLMTLFIPAIGGYSLAGSVAARVGLGVAGKAIIAGIGGAALSRPLESALEAAGAYDQARLEGLSHKEASKAADETFKKNMTLMGLDAVQFAAAFTPTSIDNAAMGAAARGLIKVRRVAGKLVFEGLTEGGEEMLQEMFIKQALGEPVDFTDPEMQLVFSLGAIAGVGLGGAGDAIATITNRGIQTLTPEQKALFDRAKVNYLGQEMDEQAATLKALDDVAEKHPEVAETIESITKVVVQETVEKQLTKESLAEVREEQEKGLSPATGRGILQDIKVTQEMVKGITNWQKAQAEASERIGAIEEEWVAKTHVGATKEQQLRIDAVITEVAKKYQVPSATLRRAVLWEATVVQPEALKRMTPEEVEEWFRAQPAEAGVKEPWQMTREEWEKQFSTTVEGHIGDFVSKTPMFGETVVIRAMRNPKGGKTFFVMNFGKLGQHYGTPEKAMAEAQHISVEKALSEGKPVPAEVLKDYPDLKAKAPSKVRYEKGSVGDAVRAAKKLKSDVDLYVYPTAEGMAIGKEAPPFGIQHIIVRPDGTHKTVPAWSSWQAGREAGVEPVAPAKVITPKPTAEVPTTPAGMPEAGLQAGIPGMAAAEVVRPQPIGKLVQARIDDYLRLREYNSKVIANRITEIKKALEKKGRSDLGLKGNLKLEQARLEALKELEGVENIADLNQLIKQIENEIGLRSMPYAGYGGKAHIDLVRHPEHRLFKGYTSKQLDEMRNVYLQARENMPEAPVIQPTPKPEPPPEVVNRVKTDPTLASDDIIVKKFIECIKDAKPAREVTEALKHEELSKRSAIFASILQGGEGYKAFEKAKGALKGFLPQGEYILDLQKFGITNAEIERMIDRIRLDDKLRPFEKLNTYEAFTNLVMGGIPTEGQLVLLEKEFGSEFVKAVMEKMPTSQKISRIAQDIANVPRTLVTIADLSATLRQGAILAFGQPVQFATAFKEQLRAVFSEKNFKVIDEVVHNNVYADNAEQHKLYIAPIGEAVKVATREEAFMGRLIERVPIIGSIVRASERAYITMLNVLRMETYAYYCKQWEGTGKTSADYDKLASFINHASGRGDLGSFSRAGSWLSAIFFSPRYIMSRIQVPLDLINTTPAVRKVIARNLVSFVGANLLAIMLFKLAGAETDDDPRSADFGKIKIGNTRIDLWAGFLPYVRVITQIITEERKSTKTGEVYTIDPIDVGVNFFRSKLAPMPGFLWDLKAGETFIGEELSAENAEKIIFEKLTPMFIQDLIEAVRDSGIAGAGYGILSGLGVGIQTYGDNWETAELKLGLPQRGDNFPYTIENEVYDVGDYYSEIGQMIGGATYEMLSQKKNIPPLVLSVAQARDIVQQISLLPNKRLTSINADPEKGDTFEQYRIQWLARQRISDAEELKQFDKDYPNAEQGNITQAQYALLVEYHSLPDGEKADFLGRHPEIYVNPRQEWLRTHPQENALLALWGKADVYSPEALSKVASLRNSLGIPENALQMEDLSEVSELKLKNQHLFDLEDAFKGLDDTVKDADGLTAKDRALQGLYADNPDFKDDKRRIEALEVGTETNPTPDEIVELWVERGKIVDDYGVNSNEAKLWLIDSKEAHQWAVDNALLTDTGEDWNENILRLRVQYQEDFQKYDDYGDRTSPNYIGDDSMRAAAREGLLFDGDKLSEFGMAYYTKQAASEGYSEGNWNAYVEYSALPEWGSWRERFLLENPDFYKEYTDPNIGNHPLIDQSKVKPLARDMVYKPFYYEFQAWDKTGGMSDKQIEKMRAELDKTEKGGRTFWEVRYAIKAYDQGVPEKYISQYIEYYKLPEAGPDRERFLMNHFDYYRNVWLGVLGNKAIDFSKLRARKSLTDFPKNVADKYYAEAVEYYNLSAEDRVPFLMSHLDYYRDVWLGILGNEPIDFSE